VSPNRYKWAAPGDINAFFGLMLDNIADLLLAIGMLAAIFGFPTSFAIQHMVPGTAVGVLVGDLLFFWMALRLARRSGRNDVTAMPLGLDTPSTIGMVLFVLGPAFLEAKRNLGVAEMTDPDPERLLQAARTTWHVGIWSIVLSGVFKFACAFASGWVRRVVPRAGLLGSLAAIALVLISFLPLIEILHYPIVGFIALAIILTTLVARVRLPWHVPGALGALLVAGTVYYLMLGTGALDHPAAGPTLDPHSALMPTGWFEVFGLAWVADFAACVKYLPIVMPFALATVVGGIDCTESAAAAGDEYDTGRIIGVEAVATLAAGLCGGVIQTTPYIGHPAYKAMGGRAAYTLATALFVGGAGLFGYFGYLYALIPKATVFPILIFIGLEITAQSFLATPRRHFPAVALACVPALAQLAVLFVDKTMGDPAILGGGITIDSLHEGLRTEILTLRILANGFIITSLLWASGLAAIIDRRLGRAAVYFLVAAACSFVGVIHSPIPGAPLALPGFFPAEFADLVHVPVQYAIAYAAVAGILLSWEFWRRASGVAAREDQAPPDHDSHA
jgi:AGZA family xanthine/uracil permease-like MFS transporter